MRINTKLIQRPEPFRTDVCQVEKVVEVSTQEFDSLLAAPMHDLPFIAANREAMYEADGVKHCMLVLSESCEDGVLVNAEGTSYARSAAYLPEARTIVRQADKEVR